MRTALGLSLLLLLAGCYKVVEPPCAHRCVDGGRCPDNYTCLADGICHLRGEMNSCQVLDLAGLEEEDDAGEDEDGGDDDGGADDGGVPVDAGEADMSILNDLDEPEDMSVLGDDMSMPDDLT